MRFDSEQCKRCPFRSNSMPGWLGAYDPGSVFSAIWKGLPFFCHSKINYESKTWEARAMKNGKLCTGSLVFSHLIKAPDREIKHEAIRRARLAVLPYKDVIDCLGPQEFGRHHQR